MNKNFFYGMKEQVFKTSENIDTLEKVLDNCLSNFTMGDSDTDKEEKQTFINDVKRTIKTRKFKIVQGH